MQSISTLNKNLYFFEKSQNCIFYIFWGSKKWALFRKKMKFFCVFKPRVKYRKCGRPGYIVVAAPLFRHGCRGGTPAPPPPPLLGPSCGRVHPHTVHRPTIVLPNTKYQICCTLDVSNISPPRPLILPTLCSSVQSDKIALWFLASFSIHIRTTCHWHSQNLAKTSCDFAILTIPLQNIQNEYFKS